MPDDSPDHRPHPIRLLPGDPAPWFHAATAANPRFNFASIAGRYVLLVFPGPTDHPAAREAHARLRAAQAEGVLDDRHATAFAVCLEPAEEGGEDAPRDRIPGLRLFRDGEGEAPGAVSRLYGVLAQPREGGKLVYSPRAFLLDPLLRVMETAPLAGLQALLDRLRRLPEPARHAGFEVPAPVLVLPRVLEPALCEAMIAVYRAGGGTESGFMVERDGRTVGVYDHAAKRRRDQEIEDEALRAALRARITGRVAPEMRKAFQFNPTRIERYIVACYDGSEGGHFRAHRDNTTTGTAHRRFAVTINLNEDFEGGELWFPEFGPRRYRPPVGGAVVFSCSLLHEATPVTCGVRYATLPFLYDDAAARVREANRHSLVGEGEEATAEGKAT